MVEEGGVRQREGEKGEGEGGGGVEGGVMG